MSHQGAEGILTFLQNPKNKPLRDLIELAANEDEEALNYIEFIQEEISKKFKSVDDSGNALPSMHLQIKLDTKDGQEGIRSVDESQIYYFNEFGVLKNEKKNDNQLSFDQYERIGEELTFYMFHILTKYFKFKPKVVGNQSVAKKKKKKKNDFKFKTILFSPKFEQCDSIIVIIPPHRGAVTYNSLAIDEGLSYGTMLPYIEKILSWNPKFGKKGGGNNKKQTKNNKKKIKKKGSDADQQDIKENDKDNKNKILRRWGIMILDPQGLDSNNNKYSIIKIFDKWLMRRIPSVGIFGFHPRKQSEPVHRRTGSDESITSTLSAVGSGPRIKIDIKNLFFIGAASNGQLISSLLHRRGQSVEKIIRGCIFLGSDDPYDANDVTKSIYHRCGINYLNSTKPKNTMIDGKKVNGDPYIIKRVSSGNARYCCQSAYDLIIKYIIKAVEDNDNDLNDVDEEAEYKKD